MQHGAGNTVYPYRCSAILNECSFINFPVNTECRLVLASGKTECRLVLARVRRVQCIGAITAQRVAHLNACACAARSDH